MMIPRFPANVLREQSLSWQIVRRSTQPPGQTGIGTVPFAETSGGGSWRADLSDVVIRTREHVLGWRALEALLDSGATQIVVSMCDKRYFPAPTIDGERVTRYPHVMHDDGTGFSDGAGYYQPAVVAYVAASAGERATRLVIAMVSGDDPQAGQHFSITHPNLGDRLYRIASASVYGAGLAEVTIRPPLRENVDAYMNLEFDFPCCVMQVAAVDGMKLDLDMRKWGKPSVSFIESLDPSMYATAVRATVPQSAAYGAATDDSLDYSNPSNSQYMPVL